MFQNLAAIAWQSSSSDEIHDLELLFIALTLFWTAAFYAIALSESLWAVGIPSSSRPDENCRYVKARNVLGILHASLVSALVLPVVWMATGEQSSVLFASSEFLTTCTQIEHPDWNSSGQAVALAGLLFTAFLFADIVISWIHGLSSWDYVLHHVAFITAGLIIRGHCMLPYNSAILLAMEASTPFLNVMLFFRNRGPAYGLLVQASGIIFVVLFVLFRLILNTYGAILLWRHRASAMPQSVPELQRCFLLGAIVAGSALQFFWFPAIARIFYKGLMNLFMPQSPRAMHISKCGGSGSSSEEQQREDLLKAGRGALHADCSRRPSSTDVA
mmetsp:Transcript_82382/g.207281  ORF Transcript_82382/g.207281 Transcript_82382/m.207281 type:complete len:330 (+) Transcript_82382:104-1093(+)